MMIFRKAIPRRTFLRGAGATLALPLLDAMVPAFALPTDPAAKPVVRLGIVYAPNGMWPMDKWTPKGEGANFEWSPTLEPLAPFRDRVLVLGGLKEAPMSAADRGGDHTFALTTYLSGVRPKRTAGRDLHLGITMDQIAAQELGKRTQLGSLEVSMVPHPMVGTCENDYSCTYLSTLSWRGPTTPLPMEYHPRAIFERLFGDSDSSSPEARRALRKENRSILDSLAEDMPRFLSGLGPDDRAKVTEYHDSIRDLERRILTAEEQSSRELPTLERPTGVPETLEEYNKLMCDLLVAAYQGDLTRVITYMMAREGPYGSRPYPEIGIPDTHHALSHHQNDAPKIEKLFRINLYHTKLFAYFLERLRSTPDGEGSLLDHSVLLYGSGLSNGNGHARTNLPTVLAGGAAGQLHGGRHIRCPEDTEITNLHLTILSLLGVRMDNLGNSTGKLELLSV
ncbi:MAG: hypothetical protein A3G20_04650 [Acidobacteria bacterium RIFCSPLOWO2_12_FULL_59_11]|nr:MAG: hypothetical protein A3G20_04650 [Acidobacteria bacterium RIFCSPLOWO2_12_FULL_59_11]